jgi:tripartite-type tricarboxylate transporter receptor subunit TctC
MMIRKSRGRNIVKRIPGPGILAFTLILLPAVDAAADDFYADKRVRIIVGSSSGGGYDTYARLIARHWDKVIPGNPTIVVQNMPGASSLKAMNHVANAAPKDGTVIGAVQNQIAFEPILKINGKGNAQYDSRTLNWIGSANKEVATVFVWHTAPVTSIDDVKKNEVLVGSSGVSTSSSYNSRLMNELLGTRFKVVYGYKGNAELSLAIERGEVQGSTGMYFSSLSSNHGQWIADKKVRIIAQLALEAHPDLKGVPLILDRVKGDARKQVELIFSSGLMGRPYVMPDGVPPSRVKAMRESFLAVLAQPALLAEAKRSKLEIQALSGNAIDKLVAAAYETPPGVVEKVRGLLKPKRDKKKK